jgi:hypothetical protein
MITLLRICAAFSVQRVNLILGWTLGATKKSRRASIPVFVENWTTMNLRSGSSKTHRADPTRYRDLKEEAWFNMAQQLKNRGA